MFYYNCSKTFIIDRFISLFNQIDGYIIFANGDVCHIYKFENTFIKLKSINAQLIKRQRKGGQSSLRFSRLAEESRHVYVVKVIDYINKLCRNEDLEFPCYLFGSKEITSMILDRHELMVSVTNGGFLDFNDDTINNTTIWLNYLTQTNINDYILAEIVLYLDTNVDMLDFDETNKDEMKFYVKKDMMKTYVDSKHYDRIKIFEYIGVKYYNYSSEEF